jgi:hypothetical protein
MGTFRKIVGKIKVIKRKILRKKKKSEVPNPTKITLLRKKKK